MKQKDFVVEAISVGKIFDIWVSAVIVSCLDSDNEFWIGTKDPKDIA